MTSAPQYITGTGPSRIPDFQRRINAWRRDLTRDRTLTSPEREFLTALASRPWGARSTLRVWWPVDTAAAHFAVHRRTVQRWIRAGIRAGYLTITVHGKKGQAQIYHLLRPAKTPPNGDMDVTPVVVVSSVPGGFAPPSPAPDDASRRRRGHRPWRPRLDPRQSRDRQTVAAALTRQYVQLRTEKGIWWDGTDDPGRVFRVVVRALRLGDDPVVLAEGLRRLGEEQAEGVHGLDWSVSRRGVLRAYRRFAGE